MFLKLNKSSGKHANTTYIFSIEENAYEEKTGNISIFVSIGAHLFVLRVLGKNQNLTALIMVGCMTT